MSILDRHKLLLRQGKSTKMNTWDRMEYAKSG